MTDQSDGHPAAGSAPRRSLKDSSAIAVITLLIAVIGAVTGTVSFVRGMRVDLLLTARYGIAQQRFSLQVGIVNHSPQGVSIVGGAVLFDGAEVAKVVQVLPSVPAVGDPRSFVDIFASAQPLPFSINPGQSLAGTVLFDWGGVEDEKLELFNKLLGNIPSADDSGRIHLRLDFRPGGSRKASVQIPAARGPMQFEEADHTPGWHSALALNQRSYVTALVIDNKVRKMGLGTFQLWKVRKPMPIFESTQPLSEATGAKFSLPALESGQYDWAVSLHGAVVAVGNFKQPCRGLGSPPPSEILSSECSYKPK